MEYLIREIERDEHRHRYRRRRRTHYRRRYNRPIRVDHHYHRWRYRVPRWKFAQAGRSIAKATITALKGTPKQKKTDHYLIHVPEEPEPKSWSEKLNKWTNLIKVALKAGLDTHYLGTLLGLKAESSAVQFATGLLSGLLQHTISPSVKEEIGERLNCSQIIVCSRVWA